VARRRHGRHVLVDKERIDIKFAQLWHVSCKLRELDKCEGDIHHFGGGNVAIAFEHARDPRACNQFAGHLEVERRQRQGLVVDHLDRRAALSKGDDWTEGGIVGDAQDEFVGLRAHDHRLDSDADDACIGPGGSGGGDDIGGTGPHRRFGCEAEPHATDVRLRCPATVF